MAISRDHDYERLDWKLLQNGSITLYWRPELLDSDKSWLVEEGYTVDEFDCSQWNSEEALHDAFANRLVLPGWYGRNLDALNDCLSELEIPDKTGRVFVFRRFDCFAKSMPKVAWTVLDIIELKARDFLLFGRRLIALVQSSDPGIAFDPVGARSVNWNAKEWLNKDRGL